MKKISLFAFCLFSLTAFSQNTWNQLLPVNSFGSNINFLDLDFDEDHFLLCGTNKITEIDPLGGIRGEISLPSTLYYSNFVRRRYDDNTGDITFLAGMRKLGSAGVFALRFFKPGQNFSSEILLPDSLGSAFASTPTLLETNDSTIMVFGRKVAYKVRIQGNNTLSLDWQALLSLPGGNCTAAVEANGNFVLFSAGGGIIGVNSTGQQVFTKNQPFSFYAARKIPDGIIACGENPAHKAVLVKLSDNGDLIWSQEFSDQKFNDVASTANGEFMVTGKSAANNVSLSKIAANGLLSWSKEYQTGQGVKVLTLADGGFFIAAAIPGSLVYGIKTDAFGETGAPKRAYFVQNRRLETAGIQATLEPSGALFYNGQAAGLVSPADSGAATIFSFAPWIAGFDGDNLLHLAAEDYPFGSAADFHAGVVQGQDGDFRRVWRATKTEIAALRRDFLTDGVIDGEVPFDMLTWPGKGNVHNRYNIDFTTIKTDPNLQAAPFEDVNADGVYNVFDGDYPRIKGDQMAWWSINDDSTHFNSTGVPLKIDLAISAYVYDCAQNETVKNTLFVDFEFINRSANTYDSTYLGFFTDFELGCYTDDYIGSIPATNSYYSYNQDAIDTNCDGGVQGFGENIPVQSVTFQNKELSHFIYYNNLGVGTPVQAQTDPTTAVENYNYLQGKWKEGTPATSGGSGYNPGSIDYVKHVFPSNPADPQGWTMCSSNLPYADRRALGTHGPFTFAAADTFNISIAFTTHHNIPHPCPDVFGLVKPAIDAITNWSNTGTLEASPNLGIVQHISAGQILTLGTDVPDAMFQWSTGATSATITISQAGEYTVTVTNETGCQNVETVLVKWSSGTNSPGAELTWTAYPNPASDYIHLSCHEALGDQLQLVLRNAQGGIIKRESFNSREFTLSLKAFPAGFYWLELWQGETFLGTRKCAHVK